MVAANHYMVGPGVDDALRTTLAGYPRGKGFGNGRVVRNLFEQAVANHATRVVGDTDPSDEDLTILVPADIPPPPV
jgi:hypothetical protein